MYGHIKPDNVLTSRQLCKSERCICGSPAFSCFYDDVAEVKIMTVVIFMFYSGEGTWQLHVVAR